MANRQSLRRRSKWLVVISVALASLASLAVPVQGRDELHDAIFQSIATQLSQMGVEVSSLPVASQLEIPATPSEGCLTPSIQDLYWDSLRNTLYFRMTCGAQKPSAPFLVRAHISPAEAELLRQRFHPDGGVGTAPSVRRNRCLQPGLLVRAGRPATLLLRRDNMKLTTPVTALECGIAGQQVRARGRKTNKLFEAEVAGENLLTATF